MANEKLIFTQDDIEKFKEKFSKAIEELTDKEKSLFSEILNQDIDLKSYDFSNPKDMKIPVKNKLSFLFKRDFSIFQTNVQNNQMWTWKIWGWRFSRPKPQEKPIVF